MDYKKLMSNFISPRLKLNTSLPLALSLFLLFFFFLDPLCMGDLFLFILVEVPFSLSYRVDVDQVSILVPSLITPFF